MLTFLVCAEIPSDKIPEAEHFANVLCKFINGTYDWEFWNSEVKYVFSKPTAGQIFKAHCIAVGWPTST